MNAFCLVRIFVRKGVVENIDYTENTPIKYQIVRFQESESENLLDHKSVELRFLISGWSLVGFSGGGFTGIREYAYEKTYPSLEERETIIEVESYGSDVDDVKITSINMPLDDWRKLLQDLGVVEGFDVFDRKVLEGHSFSKTISLSRTEISGRLMNLGWKSREKVPFIQMPKDRRFNDPAMSILETFVKYF